MIKNALKTIRFALTDNRALGLIGFGVLAMIVAWSTIGVLQRNYELEKKIVQQRNQNDVSKLENQNQKLRNTYYASDEYLELTARRQLAKAAPGERLYLVPHGLSESSSAAIAPIVEDTLTAKKPKNKYMHNLESWFEFFRGKRPANEK